MNDKNYYEKLENLLRSAFEGIRNSSDVQSLELTKEFIEHGEYGLAFDLINEMYLEQDLPIPNDLSEAGRLMGLMS